MPVGSLRPQLSRVGSVPLGRRPTLRPVYRTDSPSPAELEESFESGTVGIDVSDRRTELSPLTIQSVTRVHLFWDGYRLGAMIDQQKTGDGPPIDWTRHRFCIGKRLKYRIDSNVIQIGRHRSSLLGDADPATESVCVVSTIDTGI